MQTAKCVVVLSSFLVINPGEILQKWTTERELANSDENAETNVINLEVKWDVIRRSENGNSKDNLGVDLGLYEAMAWTTLRKSNEYKKGGKVILL